jgi:hypothetical protein
MLLTIYHQNFRGLKHNIDALTCILMAKESHLYYMGIKEHYLAEQKLLLINDRSYCLVSNLSCINNTGGGLCIYVRSDMIQNTVAKKCINFF